MKLYIIFANANEKSWEGINHHNKLLETPTNSWVNLLQLRPLLMISSLLLLLYVPQITDTYEFQEPILKTKTISIEEPLSNQLFLPQSEEDGVYTSIITGRIQTESIGLLFSCADQTASHLFFNIEKIIKKRYFSNNNLLTKNIALICYNSTEHLQNFINSLHYQTSHTALKIGIIRSALTLEFSSFANPNQSEIKTIFNPFSRGSELQTDVDYYQAIKELLQQVGINKWETCKAFTENPIFKRAARAVGGRWWSTFAKSSLCKLYESSIKSIPPTPNTLMQHWGIQSSTLSFLHPSSSSTPNPLLPKITKLCIAFLEEFAVMEDHLHSANTIYLPVDHFKYVGIKGLISVGISFMISTAIWLIYKAYVLFESVNIISSNSPQYLHNTLQPQPLSSYYKYILTILITVTSLEYTYNQTFLLSLALCIPFNLVFGQPLAVKQKELLQIIISGFNIFLCEYFSILCFPLSIITIISTLLICFIPQKLNQLIIFGCFAVIIWMQGVEGFINIWGISGGLTGLSQASVYGIILWSFVK